MRPFPAVIAVAACLAALSFPLGVIQVSPEKVPPALKGPKAFTTPVVGNYVALVGPTRRDTKRRVGRRRARAPVNPCVLFPHAKTFLSPS